MGFESSVGARRRLAAMSARRDSIQEALLHPVAGGGGATPSAGVTPALSQQLDHLAHDIAATPGAGGALLAAYAAQARALTLIVEAARRGGSSPLPAAVLAAAQEALAMGPLTGL